ncbi:hypothetical protein [Micromonospora sp. I033]
MRERQLLVGGVLAAVGAIVVAISGAILARDIALSPDWSPGPLLGVAVGVVLVLVGVETIRDRRRSAAGYRADAGPAVLFPYTPPQPESGGLDLPSYDSGGDAGSGGGDCGGGGGGS